MRSVLAGMAMLAAACAHPEAPRPPPLPGALVIDVAGVDRLRVDDHPVDYLMLPHAIELLRRERFLVVRAPGSLPWHHVLGTVSSLERLPDRYRLAVLERPDRVTAAFAPGRFVVAVEMNARGEVRSVGPKVVNSVEEARAELAHAAAGTLPVLVCANAAAPFEAVFDLVMLVQGLHGSVAGLTLLGNARARSQDWLACPFPEDSSGINSAAVALIVAVDAAGRPGAVRVLSDPGRGFGEMARACAMRAAYDPPRDADGRLSAGETGVIHVRFER